MWKNLLQDFIGDLRTQKTRALLTIFAVGWGTLSIVLLLAFGEGLKHAIVAGQLGAGDQLFMIYGGNTTRPYQGLPSGRYNALREEDLKLLQDNIPEIDMVSASYGKWGTVLKAGSIQMTTMMEGVDPGCSVMSNKYTTPEG